MTKKCQIPIDRNYSVKGRALVYFLPNKELEHKYGLIKRIIEIIKGDTEKENIILSRVSNKEVMKAIVIALTSFLLVFLAKMGPHILRSFL